MTADPSLDMWNGRFAAEGYLFGVAPNAFLKSQAHRLKPGQSVLAVADGEGRNGVWLAAQGLDVLSADFSAVAQAKARKLAAEAGVTLRFEEADLLNWAWPDAAFDAVVAIFIQFAGPAERPKLFNGIKRALKSGGLLIMQGYTPRQLDFKTGGPPHAENMYTPELLREAFAGYDILHLVEHDDEIREGPGHAGMSALIDLVAHKPL